MEKYFRKSKKKFLKAQGRQFGCKYFWIFFIDFERQPIALGSRFGGRCHARGRPYPKHAQNEHVFRKKTRFLGSVLCACERARPAAIGARAARCACAPPRGLSPAYRAPPPRAHMQPPTQPDTYPLNIFILIYCTHFTLRIDFDFIICYK